jgi:DNA-binding XRE family transcriptional regulator
MDNKKNLAEKLRERRESLGLGQDFMSEKLNITQPAYSWIENEKRRLTPKLILDIKSIKDFEDFDGSDAGPTNSDGLPRPNGVQPGGQTLASRWPLSKPLLYVMVILVGALCLDLVFQMGEYFYQGITGETEENQDIMAVIAVIYFVLGILLIRWIVFKKEWR